MRFSSLPSSLCLWVRRKSTGIKSDLADGKPCLVAAVSLLRFRIVMFSCCHRPQMSLRGHREGRFTTCAATTLRSTYAEIPRAKSDEAAQILSPMSVHYMRTLALNIPQCLRRISELKTFRIFFDAHCWGAGHTMADCCEKPMHTSIYS